MTALRVLHVDDESDIRDVVEISLGIDPDLVTRNCSSGEEALALVLEWPPDVIVLDVMMPVMDGPATLARLRDNPQTASIPVIFMTARAQSRELDLFQSLGAAGVIAKPFNPITLAAVVRGCLRRGDKALETLHHMFSQRITSDVALLTGHRSALQHASPSLDRVHRIRSIAHGLAGSCGIYGFPDIADAASLLEDTIVASLDASPHIEEIVTALDRLLACIAADGFLENGTQPMVKP